MNKKKRDNGKQGGIGIAFVCVENAGRSQMATAFAKKEVKKRSLNVEIVMGGNKTGRSRT